MSAPIAAAAASPVEGPAGPLDSDERLHSLDILRGLALFGMILVHFHQKMRLPAAGVEDLIGWGVWIFVEQKAWGTFAFLFGVGFAILLRRLQARSASVATIYLRRLATLALFGLIAQIGFGFHILLEYACWGVALLLIRRWSTPSLLVLAALAVCGRPLVALIVPSSGGAASVAVELAHAADVAAQSGSYAALLAARWALFRATLLSWQNLLPDTNLALFIVGLLSVRHGVVDSPLAHVRVIAGWMTFGVLSWAATWLLPLALPALAASRTGGAALSAFGLLQDQWLCFAYIGAVVLFVARRPRWTARLAGIGAAGRMALTNYLLQAMALDALASHYGASLRLRPYAYVPAAVLLFGTEMAISVEWLYRFRFGPLEWAWRTITYLRPQPLRRAGPRTRRAVAGSYS